MAKIVKLYCEGADGSHDKYILEKLIADIPSVKIEAIGSKLGAKSAIQTYEKLTDRSDYYCFFRDRDFDRPIPDKCLLQLEDKYTYYSYRNTIENYLFSVPNFYNFIKEQKLDAKYQIANEDAVKDKFIQAAYKIRYYQAIRHTMGEMRIPTDFGTKLTDQPSGVLPTQLQYSYCREQALEKISKAKLLTEDWTETKFDEILGKFNKKFDGNFMNNLEFLVHFQGKDFAASLQTILPDFPMKSYYKFAKKHFNYTCFPDLIELHTLLKAELNRG